MKENLCDVDGHYLSLWRGLLPSVDIFGQKSLPVIWAIKKQVARNRGVSVEALELPSDVPGSRIAKIAEARHEAMWLLRQVKRSNGEHKLSYPQIGAAFGGRDHTTAMHAVRAHQARLDASCEQTENV